MHAVVQLVQPSVEAPPRRAQSLGDYLSDIAERCELDHLLVTDEGGLLFATAQEHAMDDELAALAPHRASGELPLAHMDRAPTLARKVVLQDAILYVAACGEMDRCEAASSELEPLLRSLLEM